MTRCGRILTALLLGAGFSLLPGGTAAWAAPENACSVSDPKLATISGIVAVDDGFAVVTEGDESGAPAQIYLLDSKCAIKNTLTSPNGRRAPEDLARTADGSYWVADIGDSDSAPERETIAVHLFPPSGEPTIQRMRYPDGPKNAAALLVENGNVPVVVTRTTTGQAKVYKAGQAISGPSKSADQAVALTLVGTLTLGGTEQVTGGAMSPDGKRVALRTYGTIYEWNVAGGDVAKTLVSGKSRKLALTGQQGDQQGEAVAYTADGKSFLTVAKAASASVQRWPSADAAAATTDAGKDGGGADSGGGFLSSISFSQITTLVAIVGVIGLALLAVGIVGIVRFRRRAEFDPVSGPPRPGARVGVGPRAGPEPDAQNPSAETMNLPRVTGAVYGGRPEPVRGGAAVPTGAAGVPSGAASVPPTPRGAARPAGAGAGWGPDRGEAGFRSEGSPSGAAPVSGAASVSGPAAGAASVPGAAPVSGPAGRGTVYGAGGGTSSGRVGGSASVGRAPGYDAESTGGGRRPGTYDSESTGGSRRPGGYDSESTGGSRRPGGYDSESTGGRRPGTYDSESTGSGRRPGGYDSESTGGGRVRRPQGPPPTRPGPGDPTTTGGGRVRDPGGSGRPAGNRGAARPGSASVPPPPPVDRSAPTRTRRAAAPPPPPGTTYGGGSDTDGRGRDSRDTDGRGRDSRTGDVRGGRGGRDGDWESTGGRGSRDGEWESTGGGRGDRGDRRDPDHESTGSGRARPPGERMRPPPPPGGRREGGRREDDGRPPPPPGAARRPPPPPDRGR